MGIKEEVYKQYGEFLPNLRKLREDTESVIDCFENFPDDEALQLIGRLKFVSLTMLCEHLQEMYEAIESGVIEQKENHEECQV